MTSHELVAEQLGITMAGQHLLDEVTVTASSGEVLGIAGPSGSGKTTLLLALAGLHRPSRGRVLFDGIPRHGRQPWPGVTQALVLQILGLSPVLTAAESVSLVLQSAGRSPADIRQVTARALDLVGLGELGHQLTEQLSGGQRQRTAVARALVAKPDLLLVDEPTAQLDRGWQAVVLDQLRAASAAGAVVVIASHDPDVLASCDRVQPLTTPRRS
jgi:ABC-type lipoprotein export system ATPase subunit